MPIIRARPDTFHDDSTMPTDRLKKVNDILDWIASVFGFQVMNIHPCFYISHFTWIENCPVYKCRYELGATLIINP